MDMKRESRLRFALSMSASDSGTRAAIGLPSRVMISGATSSSIKESRIAFSLCLASTVDAFKPQ
jgi:hypothetical protein